MQLGFVILAILAFICLSYGYGATVMLQGFDPILAAKVIYFHSFRVGVGTVGTVGTYMG